MLRIFLTWLDLLGIPETRRHYRLSIHETADVVTQELWWQEELGLSAERFGRATLKRHNPKPTRHNTEGSYHGCLTIEVTKSSDLYYSIDGWWRGIVEASGRSPDRSL